MTRHWPPWTPRSYTNCCTLANSHSDGDMGCDSMVESHQRCWRVTVKVLLGIPSAGMYVPRISGSRPSSPGFTTFTWISYCLLYNRCTLAWQQQQQPTFHPPHLQFPLLSLVKSCWLGAMLSSHDLLGSGRVKLCCISRNRDRYICGDKRRQAYIGLW